MDNGNAYTDRGGTGQTITGTWGTEYKYIEEFFGRLIFNTGNSNVEFTDTDQPWDRAGGGTFSAFGAVTALETYVPQFGTTLAAILYVGSSAGWQFTSDLAAAQTIKGSPPPMKDSLAVASLDWIVYLSSQGGIHAINGMRVIDLGRRFKSLDAKSGPLDNINLANTLTVGNAVYDEKTKKAIFLISTAVSGVPDTSVVIDFERGEPLFEEPQASFEQHVRCLPWAGMDYLSMQVTQDGLIGLRSAGTMWTLNNGTSDYGTDAIDTEWFSPIFDGGSVVNEKGLKTWFGRVLRSGAWDAQMDILLDRDSASSKTFSFTQGITAAAYGTAVYGTGTYAVDGFVKSAKDIDLVVETFQLKLSQNTAGENFNIIYFEQRYDILVEQR